MTPKEIVEATFRFEPTGTVPYWIQIVGEVAERMDRHYGSADWRKRIISYIDGGHAVGEGECTDLGKGKGALSAYGYRFTQPLCHLEEPTFKEPSLDGFTWPEAERLADWDALAQNYAAKKDTFKLCGMCYGFVERASFMRGVEDLMMDMIEHPQFVHDLFDGYLKLRLELIDMIIDRIPVEGIFDGGDDCDQRGPMMGLAKWQEFIKPRLQAVIEHVHAKGLPVVAHMCGNVRPIIDDLLDIKLDVLESLQPEAMDVYELKKATAGRMALIGGLGTQQTLPFGTPEEIYAETKKLIRELGKGGGYILASAKAVMEDVPTRNAVAYFEAAVEQ
jgi:uroporphyrinogen decarboxylase